MSFNASWLKSASISLGDYNKKQQAKATNLIVSRTIEQSQKVIPVQQDHFQTSVISAFLNKQKLREKTSVIPAPPRLLSSEERQDIKVANRFKKKYQFIWILVSEPDHKARRQFLQIYKDDANSYTNNIDNMISKKQVSKIFSFTNGGLQVKILSDYASFKDYKNDLNKLEKDEKILQFYIEQGKKGQRIVPSRKTKVIQSATELIEEYVAEEMERSRKDIPYYNFIHFNSSPQLFNRRSILQSCLFSKSQQQLMENHQKFMIMINEDTENSFNNRLNQVFRDGGHQTEKRKRQEIDRANKKKLINQQFDDIFTKYLDKFYPFQQQSNQVKEEIANWAIVQYSIESSIYVVLNNTIRFSLNKQKIKPVSSFVRYLYEALRYYFTEKHYRFKFIERQVYRGSRISLSEQRSFRKGQYLWNLGFTSTSKKQLEANRFLKHIQNQQERVRIIIKFSQLTGNADYLWDQEGFCSIDQINEIREKILVDEEEVLFNPLNVFEILSWDLTSRVLVLLYSPHLDIMEKKKKGRKLQKHEEDLLQNLSKLKNRSYDKGQQLLEDGNPAQAIKYYELSQQQGQSLTIQQKQTFIQSLVQVGDLHKIQPMLQQFYAQEGVNPQANEFELDFKDQSIQFFSGKSIEDHIQIPKQTIERNIQKVNKSLQVTKIFQTVEDFQVAAEKAEKTSELASKLAIKVPDRQTLLLQVQSYVELSKVKYKVNQTLQSIKQCLRSLKTIDELAPVNLCFKLQDLGNFIRNFKNLPSELYNIKKIKEDKQFLDIDIEKYKKQVLNSIEIIRTQTITDMRKSVNFNKGSMLDLTEVQQQHQIAEQVLERYFEKRVQKNIHKFQVCFVLSFYEAKNFKISTLSNEEDKERLRQLKQKLLLLKNQYKDVLEMEMEIYELLYQNLYKTKVKLQPCLNSYKNFFFKRYELIMEKERQVYGDSVQYVKFLRKYGQFLCDYGQIIEKKKGSQVTKSEKLGIDMIKNGKRILKELGEDTEQKKFFTFEKTEINNSLSSHYKSHSISKNLEKETEVSLQESTLMFSNLIECNEQNKQMHSEDKNINKSFFFVKDASIELEAYNMSSNISLKNSTYRSRLQKCQESYSIVMNFIDRHSKEQQMMEKNINLAKLHLLMAENQGRLGFFIKSMQYLIKCTKTLYIALKLDPKDPNMSIFNRKLLYGNKVKLDCLKLQARLKTLYGKKLQQNQHLHYLKNVYNFIHNNMNDPLAEADLDESIGVIAMTYCVMYKQINPKQAFDSLQNSIQIRKKLLGPYNKCNARCYTMLVDLANQKQRERTQQFYRKGKQVYGRIDTRSDPAVKIYEMLLQTSYLISINEFERACQVFHEDLTFYDEHPNRLILFSVVKEMRMAGKFLFFSSSKEYQERGYYWIQKCLSYLKQLEAHIRLHYDDEIRLKKFKYQRYSVLLQKLRVYDDIIMMSQKLKKKEQLEKYLKEFNEMKSLYGIHEPQIKIKHKQQELDPLGQLIKTVVKKGKRQNKK